MAVSTARHPQTDGQTERMNQTLEVALRAYTAGNKESWSRWLPLLAHAYNSTPHDSTGYTPYFLLLGFEPRGPVDYMGGIGPAVGRPGNMNREAKKWLETMRAQFATARAGIPKAKAMGNLSDEYSAMVMEFHNHRQSARDSLVLASAGQARAHNARRRQVLLEPGDEVLVNPHSLEWVESKGAGTKLVQRWTGPFVVQARIHPNVYDLAMPDSYPGSTVFNIEHLKKYHCSSKWKDDRSQLRDLREDWAPSDEYEVEGIITHGWSPKENRLKYYVRWAGYGPQHDSWVSIPDMRNAKQLIRSYHDRVGKTKAQLQKEAEAEYRASLD